MAQAPNHWHSPFEAMPLELHVNVLSHLSGPEDVLSTIQASPTALHALQAGRERIYAALIQTRLAPQVFREFLAILNAPDHNTCPTVGPRQTKEEWVDERESILQDWKAWEQKASEFLRSHALGATYLTPSPDVNPTGFKNQTRFMVRLYFCVSRLISYYLPHAHARAIGTMTSLHCTLPPPINLGSLRMRDFYPPSITSTHINPAGPEWPPLNDTELLRMQRGLLRFELCCRLIGMPSMATYPNTRVYDAVAAPRPYRIREIWELNPFGHLLPVDEMEEVICASEYVHSLYSRLRSSFLDDLQEEVLDLNQSRGKDDSNLKKSNPVEYWMSLNPFEPLKGTYLPGRPQGEFATRLGLVFVDRVIRSTPKDRRDLMRTAFQAFGRPEYGDRFFLDSWCDIVYGRGFDPQQDPFSPFEVGPHCNDILKTCSIDPAATQLLARTYQTSLRRKGWAFFDDQFKIRSLQLPELEGHSPDSLHKWVRGDSHRAFPLYSLELSHSVLSARFTEEEWSQLFEKYSPKGFGDDFQAMSRFVADARAVADFSSNRIPQMI